MNGIAYEIKRAMSDVYHNMRVLRREINDLNMQTALMLFGIWITRMESLM